MANYPYTVPAEQAFMGKARTYSAQTQFRQQAVRLRALKDNPRDPAEIGAIGSDWAVDEPSAIVEEGSNSNGSYIMYAGGKAVNNSNLVAGVEYPTVSIAKILFCINFMDSAYRFHINDFDSYVGGWTFYVCGDRTISSLGFYMAKQATNVSRCKVALGITGRWY